MVQSPHQRRNHDAEPSGALLERLLRLESEVQRLDALLSLHLDAHGNRPRQMTLSDSLELAAETTNGHPAGLLSPREMQVLRLFAAATPCKKIARQLGTEPQTVRNQLASIRRKLGAESKDQLLAIALAQRWLVDS